VRKAGKTEELEKFQNVSQLEWNVTRFHKSRVMHSTLKESGHDGYFVTRLQKS